MLISTPNIPPELHQDKQIVVGFLQALINYKRFLIQTGTRITWKSTVAPEGGYLQLDGSVITNSDYPQLVAYAANDATFTVGATTTTLPVEANTWVKA